MADKKISQLTALGAASVAPNDDVLAIVDTSAIETKKITAKDVVDGALNAGSANGVLYLNGSKAATSGSALTFSGTQLAVTGSVSSSNAGNENYFLSDGTTRTSLQHNANALYYNVNDNSATTGSFIWRNTSSFSELMRLNSTGLLIGNISGYGVGSAESNSLQAKGPIVFAANNTSSASNRNWAFQTNVAAAGALSLAYSSTNTGWPNAAYAFVVDSPGNLGLGVTPSAWVSTSKGFQVGSGGYASLSQQHNASTNLMTNAYEHASNAWKYIASAYAGRYNINPNDGIHSWYTAASGTAGNTISFTQAMTLTAAGNLGIVNTSPDYNLSVGIPGTTANSYIQLGSTTTGTGNIFFGDTTGTGSGSYSGYIQYDHNVNAFIFGTSATERARITSGGYAKFSNNGAYLGSTASYHEFNTNAADWTLRLTNTQATAGNCYGAYIKYTNAAPNGTANDFLVCEDNAATRAVIRSNGGLANFQANNVNLSDERVKTDIKPLGSYWDKIKAIEIVTFKYKDQTRDDDNVGVIAQQVESVAPEFVDVDGFGETPEDGMPLKTVYTTDMYHAAIKALQEAMTRIEQLEAKVAALEA